MSDSLKLSKISCSNCGAELLYDPGTQMSNCNFCGSKFEIESAAEEKVMLPDSILPFSVVKDLYNKTVLEWLSEGDYTPDDVLESSAFSDVNGLYLPMWLFNGKYSGNWSASSGYNRTEYYTEYSSTQKKYVRRSRTVTDWRPSSGSVAGVYTVLSYAGESDAVDSSIATYAHGTGFKRGDIKSFNAKYTQGFNLLEFKKDEIDAWEKYGESQVNTIVNNDGQTRVPGDKYKDFYIDVSTSDEAKSLKVYIPFWITYYKYKGTQFHVHMDGTSTVRIDGTKPVDEERKKAADKKYLKGHIGCGLTILLFCFVVWGLDYRDQEDFGYTALGILTAITCVLYGVGHYQKTQLIKKSKEARQETLRRIQENKGMIPIRAKTEPKKDPKTEPNTEPNTEPKADQKKK